MDITLLTRCVVCDVSLGHHQDSISGTYSGMDSPFQERSVLSECIYYIPIMYHTPFVSVYTLRLVLFAGTNFSDFTNDLDGIKFSYLRYSENDVLYFTVKI